MLVKCQEKEEFQSQLRNSSITEADMEKEAKILKDLILHVINQKVPKKKPVERSKPWWTPELKELRKQMADKQRKWTISQDNQQWKDFQQARNIYFSAIKTAKSNC
jgi:hypothetical protein